MTLLHNFLNLPHLFGKNIVYVCLFLPVTEYTPFSINLRNWFSNYMIRQLFAKPTYDDTGQQLTMRRVICFK